MEYIDWCDVCCEPTDHIEGDCTVCNPSSELDPTQELDFNDNLYGRIGDHND